jgi:hypothetical protein
MSVRELQISPSVQLGTLKATIFDVDGVLLASPMAVASSSKNAVFGVNVFGVIRHDDAALLQTAGADLVVTSLDEVAGGELAEGRMCRMPA